MPLGRASLGNPCDARSPGRTPYEHPTLMMADVLERVAASGEEGLRRSDVSGQIQSALLRWPGGPLIDLRDVCLRSSGRPIPDTGYVHLTELGVEALQIRRSGRAQWSEALGRWVPRQP